MLDLQSVRSLLFQLLKNKDAELGARLKVRLQALSLQSFGVRFDEKEFGFGKFSDFLRAISDVVVVEAAHGSTDVSVRLRSLADSSPSERRTLATPAVEPVPVLDDTRPPRLPNQVWQAFTNPDPRRRRYLNRRTFDVVHFLEPAETRLDELNAQRVLRSAEEFVEISFIQEDEQRQWIRDFLRSADMQDRERKTLDGLFSNATYSSQLNTTFVAALGAKADQWRKLRGSRIYDRVRKWCTAYDVNLDSLVGDGFTPARPVSQAAPDHQTIHALIESLSDSELRSLLVPIGAVLRFLENARTKSN